MKLLQVKLCFFNSLACSRPDRLKDIANRFNLDQEAVLDNVLFARAYTSKYKSISVKFNVNYERFKIAIISYIIMYS